MSLEPALDSPYVLGGFEREALCWLPDVRRFALCLTRDESDAADLVQETFWRAFCRWETYAPGTDCRAWLFAICRNVFLRASERARRQLSCDDVELEALATTASRPVWSRTGVHDGYAEIDVRDAIDRALSELPIPYRDAVILVDMRDQPYDTAAQVLGVPVGTIRSRLSRGRRLLQHALIEFARDAGLRSA